VTFPFAGTVILPTVSGLLVLFVIVLPGVNVMELRLAKLMPLLMVRLPEKLLELARLIAPTWVMVPPLYTPRLGPLSAKELLPR